MKVWNYFFISITMMLILTFLGFQTGFNSIFNLIGFDYTPSTGEINEVTTSASGIYNTLFGSGSITGILLALGLSAGAVIVGLYRNTSTENLILLPFITGTLVLFIQTFVSIMNYSIANYPGWVSAVIIVVLLPFTAGYVVALAEFFRGTD